MAGKRLRNPWRPGDIKTHAGVPSAIPAGWTLADHRIADIADFPRLYAAVGQAWILGADVFDEGLQFRIPDGTRLLRGGTWAAGVPIACAYPLDDDGTLAAAFATSLLPMDAPGYQAFTFTTLANDAIYLALAGDALGAENFPRPAAAPMAVQYTVSAAELPPAAAGTYGGLMIAVVSAGGAVVGHARVMLYGYAQALIDIGQGGYAELYVNDVAGAQSDFATSVAGKSAAIYVTAAGSIGYTVAGVDRGAIPGLTVGATEKIVFALYVADTGNQAGLTFSGALLTNAADITEPVPAGSTDPCGNVVGELPAGTSNVGTRAGSTDSGGHALTQGELPDLTFPSDAAGGTGGNAARMKQGSITADEVIFPMGGAAHSHTINPEHVRVLVLVKT